MDRFSQSNICPGNYLALAEDSSSSPLINIIFCRLQLDYSWLILTNKHITSFLLCYIMLTSVKRYTGHPDQTLGWRRGSAVLSLRSWFSAGLLAGYWGSYIKCCLSLFYYIIWPEQGAACFLDPYDPWLLLCLDPQPTHCFCWFV